MTRTSYRRPAVLLLVLAALAAAAPASAHTVLRSSTPSDGASLPAPPADVQLVFDESVVTLGTEVAVSGPAGPLTLDPLAVDGATVTQPLPADLPAGPYEVRWRATSADGHPVSGELGFSANAASPVPVTEPTTEPAPAATTEPSPTSTGTATPAATVSGDGETGLSTAAGVALAVGALAAVGGGVAALVSKGRRPTSQD